MTTKCPLTLRGSAAFDSEGVWGDALAAFNKEGAMVAIHEQPQQRIYSFDGVIDHVGHEGDTLYWGLWRRGAFYSDPGSRRSTLDEGRSMAYIVGVSSYRAAISDRMSGRLRRLTSLPTEGSSKYSMIGQFHAVEPLVDDNAPLSCFFVRADSILGSKYGGREANGRYCKARGQSLRADEL